MNRSNRTDAVIRMLVSGLLLFLEACGSNQTAPRSAQAPQTAAAPAAVKDAKLLIEHNATDADTGFQGFADGPPWNELTVTGPNGVRIATVTPMGGLFEFGLTELFYETSEPANDEVPIADVLARLPAGSYRFATAPVDPAEGTRSATLTHAIPAGSAMTFPPDGTLGLDPGAVVISWAPVTTSISNAPVTIVGYQVIVEEDAPPPFPRSFAKPVLSVHLPATATNLSVPAEFMRNNTCYKYEVLAIEESGNQTLVSAGFETGLCTPAEEPPDGAPRLKQAKLLIEHNATDADTGFQGFADGDPWNELTISGPGNVQILRVTPAGGLFDFGLTELFFETNEPENAKVPIAQMLARLPEGSYSFRGVMVGGGTTSLSATLTHRIPAAPTLLTPAHEATGVDPTNTVVSWQPVTTGLDGKPIKIVGYQVIVEEDLDELPFPETFAKPVFSVYLPASATRVKVPVEFMREDTGYDYEVLAIEEGGNQTLSSAGFETLP